MAAAVAAFHCGGAPSVDADARFGGVTLSGVVQSQNIVRHADVDEYDFIQQRNTAWLGADWDLLAGRARDDHLDLTFARQARLRLRYRGVYDSVYDYAPIFASAICAAASPAVPRSATSATCRGARAMR